MRLFRAGSLLIGLSLLMLLTGCGQKGPLSLPKPQAEPQATQSSPPAKP